MDTSTYPTRYSSFQELISSCGCGNDRKPTHTRIGNKGSIRGGKYYIDESLEEEFLYHYFNDVVSKNRDEYMTEKQLQEGGCIVVDLDFRYPADIRDRQHNYTDILDLISIYQENLKKIFDFDPEVTKFPIFVFEKPNVNISNEDVTKDGIHIIIGIQLSNAIQVILRDMLLSSFNENVNDLDFINDLPLIDTCTWSQVLDEGISKGHVNWQLYGSKKPDNQAYKLKYAFQVTIDATDNEFQTEEMDVTLFTKDFDHFKQLSVRYREHPVYAVKETIMNQVNKRKGGRTKKARDLSSSANNSSSNLRLIPMMNQIGNSDSVDPTQLVPMNQINTKEKLDLWRRYLEQTLNESSRDYKILETHKFALILPEKFYGDGSYNDWIRLAFALKNTEEMLFITWALVSSKKNGFDYYDIPNLYDQWDKINKRNIDDSSDSQSQDKQILTSRSIRYWAKEYNPEEYEEIKIKTLGYYVNNAIESDNDRPIAEVLYQLESDRFVCSALTGSSSTWYEFCDHRWLLDKGLRIRKSGISEDLYGVFYKEHGLLMRAIQTSNTTDLDNNPEYVQTIRKNKQITSIMSKCHNSVQKNHIAKEAAELFYDTDFGDKLDQDKWTLGFINGVVDLQTGEFRDGRALDYISKSTNIPYFTDDEMNKKDNKEYAKEIQMFMSMLFPNSDLCEYVWEHLASVLVGANFSQTFNIYKGSGSNGKSLLTELMSIALGDYCNPTAPISIITSKRQQLGGTSSEVYALRGIRYAIFQEPTAGMTLNEGAMKEMTGDAKIQARELYSASTSFDQMYSLAVCTNSLFQIKSQDEGTWRRLRIVEFESTFKNPDEYEKMLKKSGEEELLRKHIYKKDPTLRDRKLNVWAPVFMRMLIDRAVKNQGIVKDCDKVLNETKKYRLKQDLVGQFIEEKIVECEDGNITKQELSINWKMWCDTNQAHNAPKLMDVCDNLSKLYPSHGKNGWKNCKIVNEDDNEFDL